MDTSRMTDAQKVAHWLAGLGFEAQDCKTCAEQAFKPRRHTDALKALYDWYGIAWQWKDPTSDAGGTQINAALKVESSELHARYNHEEDDKGDTVASSGLSVDNADLAFALWLFVSCMYRYNGLLGSLSVLLLTPSFLHTRSLIHKPIPARAPRARALSHSPPPPTTCDGLRIHRSTVQSSRRYTQRCLATALPSRSLLRSTRH